MLDGLEHLSQQLSYALPECIISQIIISSDRFLGYAWSRYLFVGKRTAMFPSLDAARFRLEDRHISSLIVDMESLTTSRFAALEMLRSHCLSKDSLRTWLLVSHQDPPMKAFLAAAGPFEVLERNQSVQHFRDALLAPPSAETSDYFSPTEWQLLTLLAQGQTLINAARQLKMPYHRAVYRLGTLLQRCGLSSRQALMQLLHRLSLDVNQ